MLPTDLLTLHFRLDDPHKKALARLGLLTVRDLLYHFPVRYEQAGACTSVSHVGDAGNEVVLFGTIHKPETRKAWKSKRPMSEAWLEDGTGKIKLMWFNQPYIAKTLFDGALVKVTGRVEGGTSRYIANPEIERASGIPYPEESLLSLTEPEEETVNTADTLFAIYPESAGVTSRWIRHAVHRCISKGAHTKLEDSIEKTILARYHLPSLESALLFIHTPQKEKDAQGARKRFSFEEVFTIQVAKHLVRKTVDAQPTFPITKGKKYAEDFLAHLPFPLTEGQEHALNTILKDMHEAPAMSRLLEGDVGSGKTAVAATSAYAVISHAPEKRPSARLQVAYMAPTEILAEQHFASFISLFKHIPVSIGLITGTVCRKYPSKTDPSKPTKLSRTQLLSYLAQGEIAILIGTHALIQEKVRFRDLALVIVDEQHRFGVTQRKTLLQKNGKVPHLLSMTATPIPRTLALTLYGDLDLSLLEGMPPGRKQVITQVVQKGERSAMYEAVRKELQEGRQVYVICPRIDEPDPKKAGALQTKSVLMEAEQLRTKELRDYRIAVLHGQMKPTEKEVVMRAFLAHETDVLVATSVVEVGVNVPNATVIVIEGAERFGLAQLHQLRGRVVRSTQQAYCFLLTSAGHTTSRLRALEKAKNGFELAEMDLAIRGPGELYGRSQSGLTDLGMEALKNLKMVEAARNEAFILVEKDPTLTLHPVLKECVEEKTKKLHFE